METQNRFKGNFYTMPAIIGLILIFPTTYFLAAVLFKYGLGNGLLFDPLEPFFTNRVVDMFIFLSPIAAMLINIIPILRVKTRSEEGLLKFNFEIKMNKGNIAVGLISFCYIAVMFSHAITENLGHYYRGQM